MYIIQLFVLIVLFYDLITHTINIQLQLHLHTKF